MEPLFMNMQSYPHQDPMQYRPRCYSGMEPRPPMSYGCCPWGGHYGYATPGACHGCSNHAYMPTHYAWGSPYSHVAPYHYPGNHPYFPAHYMPHPHYNVMEHPRYEYEKSVPLEHHCCGCTHHPVYPKELNNVKIEEEEPERERRKNDSMVPLQYKNPPYPIVWLPPDYKEHGKLQKGEGRKDDLRDVKVHENGKTSEQQLPFLKGWLPVDLNNVISSKQKGDGEKNDHQDGGKRDFQFPLFWIPYKTDDKEHERDKVKDVNLKPSLDSEKGSGYEQNLHVYSGNAGEQTTTGLKDKLVKEVEQHVGKESSLVQEKERDSFAKDGTEKGEKKVDHIDKVSPKDGSKRKSPSPPKSSKLPPVCLRVDPLPRKKSASGKSRSPSPPGDKKKLEVKSTEASRAHTLDNGERVKEGNGAKTIAVVDGNASPEEPMNVNVEIPLKLPAKSQDDVLVKQAEVKTEEEHTAQKLTEDDAVVKSESEDIVSARGEKEEPFGADGTKIDAVKKCRELSEEEAAVIIQSAFRRFDVCRWKPIEKLKQIAKVREQIADVKRLIHDLEQSSDIQGRGKQKNIIAETIMSLLLKLDTIQGLHPSIREVRKSVVRELVCLQEQLDSLMVEKPENSPTQEAVMRCDNEDSSNKNEGVMKSENGNEINSINLQNQIDNFEETNLIEEAATVKIGMEEASENSLDVEGVKAAQGPAAKDEDEKSSEVIQNNEASISEEHNEVIIPKQGSEISSLQDDSSARETDSAPDEHDLVENELAELPQGVLDDFCVEDTNHAAVETDSSKSDQSKKLEEEFIGSIVQETYHDTADKENQQTMETELGADKENQQTIETHEKSDSPLNAGEQGTEATGLGGSLEEVDSGNGDSRSESSECKNITADLIEPSEGSDDGDKLQENSGSKMEEEQLELPHQESDHEHEDEAKSNDGTAACITEQSEALGINPSEGQECNAHPSPEEAVEHGANAGDDIEERNRRLVEENERLREMMEKLLKSGEQQLTAMSSLSGRVKEMEKRLSRKKKLKLKQSKAPRSSKFNGSAGEKKTIEVTV